MKTSQLTELLKECDAVRVQQVIYTEEGMENFPSVNKAKQRSLQLQKQGKKVRAIDSRKEWNPLANLTNRRRV
jgi:hypothetical protein